MYLTFADYISMGGKLDETSFNNVEFEAEAFIDWVTFNRLKNDFNTLEKYVNVPNQLKKCVFALMDLIDVKNATLGKGLGGVATTGGSNAGIVSQENDGVSITYNVLSADSGVVIADKEMNKVCNRYLQGLRNSLGHYVLYRGVYRDEW